MGSLPTMGFLLAYSVIRVTILRALIKELCNLGGIHKICTTPYHLQGDGQCKWFNSTLISMIGTLSHWRDFNPTLVHAYYCMKSNATEFSPHYLMFGWKLRLGLNIQFGLQMEEQVHRVHHEYVSQLEDKLWWAYNLAQEMQE